MVRVLVVLVLVVTLMAGCASSSRTPAIIVGGAIAIGGIVMTTQANGRSCDSGPLEKDLNCASEAVSMSVVGMIIAGIGLGLLAGAALGGDRDDAPTPVAVEPPPAPIADAGAPPEDPANPSPAMEPEPSQW